MPDRLITMEAQVTLQTGEGRRPMWGEILKRTKSYWHPPQVTVFAAIFALLANSVLHGAGADSYTFEMRPTVASAVRSEAMLSSDDQLGQPWEQLYRIALPSLLASAIPQEKNLHVILVHSDLPSEDLEHPLVTSFRRNVFTQVAAPWLWIGESPILKARLCIVTYSPFMFREELALSSGKLEKSLVHQWRPARGQGRSYTAWDNVKSSADNGSHAKCLPQITKLYVGRLMELMRNCASDANAGLSQVDLETVSTHTYGGVSISRLSSARTLGQSDWFFRLQQVQATFMRERIAADTPPFPDARLAIRLLRLCSS